MGRKRKTVRRRARHTPRWRVALCGGGAGAAVILAALALGHRAPQPPRAVVAIPAAPKPRTVPPVAMRAPLRAPAPSKPTPPPEPAWQRFAAAAPAAEGQPRIAIVIDDLGLDRARTERAIALAAPVTLSFMAYASDVRAEAESARAAGHELLVHVPMEPMSPTEDMGPYGLSTGLRLPELMRRLDWDLGRFDGYVGINNHMGSRFTADRAGMEPVIAALKSRGLLFLDSRTTGATVGAALAQRDGVPFAERDVFLDDDESAAGVARQLALTEETARRRGTAIAIGHPHDATLAVLARWITTLPEKHLVLVPVTGIVMARAGALLHASSPRQAAATERASSARR